MSRLIAIAALLLAARVAQAQEQDPATRDATTQDATTQDATTRDATTQDVAAAQTIAPPDLSDQGIGASLGIAGGGRVTPGGLRVTGHYLYQLTEQDWFDGTASFTFGSGAGGCFRDRMDDYLCDHGLVDGVEGEVAANVRRFFGGRGDVWPFARAGIGIGLVRYTDDDVTGLAVPLHVGGGLRMAASEGVAVTVEATLDVGFGLFTRSLGLQPQLGGSVTAGAEFRL